LTPRGNTIYTKVFELISPITGSWDEDLLRDLFLDIDVERILQIPLNNRGFGDFIAWHYTKHGHYTVKSGYYIQRQHHFGPTGPQLAHLGIPALNPVWKTIWKMKLPRKIKIFACRALHGLMPLKSILVNRRIGHIGQCPICNLDAEDVYHLLFLCLAVTDIWEILGLSLVIEQAVQVDRSRSVVLECILRDQNQTMPGVPSINVKEVIVTTCWYIWWIRRRRVRNEEVPPTFKCKMSIKSIVSNAAKANIKPSEQRDAKWSKPVP
jgi:hypothetical protein